MDDRGVGFPKSKKHFSWEVNESPGPAVYSIQNSEKYLKPGAKLSSFTKSKKQYWLNQQPKADAPGPIYKPSKHYLSKMI